jgi:hypothetical protein
LELWKKIKEIKGTGIQWDMERVLFNVDEQGAHWFPEDNEKVNFLDTLEGAFQEEGGASEEI